MTREGNDKDGTRQTPQTKGTPPQTANEFAYLRRALNRQRFFAGARIGRGLAGPNGRVNQSSGSADSNRNGAVE